MAALTNFDANNFANAILAQGMKSTDAAGSQVAVDPHPKATQGMNQDQKNLGAQNSAESTAEGASQPTQVGPPAPSLEQNPTYMDSMLKQKPALSQIGLGEAFRGYA